MVEVSYGSKNESPVVLETGADLIAVRTRSKRSLRGGPVLPAVAAEVADGQVVAAFPDAGVEVYRVPASPARRSLTDRKLALRRDPDVRFAGGVLVDGAGQPVLYTENIFIKFVDTADVDDCRALLRDRGLVIKEELEYATNAFFTACPEGTGQKVFEVANELLQRPDVEYCHPELIRKRERRAIFAPQWHLKRTEVAGRVIDAHAGVEAAHAAARGEGIVIAVIDDGVDIDHPEFKGFGKVTAPRDVMFALSHLQAFNPRPKDGAEDHGTAVAGVACAAGTDGASGVAPAAKLMAIRLAAGLGSQQEAAAFKWAADNGADVISCSWGPADGAWWDPDDPVHRERAPLPASTKLAIDYAINNGRGGKGCVVLFAAGNGNESVDNDGYASYDKVMAVAACSDRGQRSVYSDVGQAVWCAFPSSDFGWPEADHPDPLTPGIYTTDRMARLGYNAGSTADGDRAGNYTNSFGGTSSACPGAAGVAALILSINPALRWHEVKDVMRRACQKIDPQSGAYDSNGHSRLYGFGRIDAQLAVALAQPQPKDALRVNRTFNQTLPDLQTILVSLDVAETAKVRELMVSVDLLHTYIGDLVLTLVPPVGRGLTEVVLQNRSGGSKKNLKRTFDVSNTPGLAALRGVAANGAWGLRISDQAAQDAGTLVEFALEFLFESAPTLRPPALPPRRAAPSAPPPP
jgi:subtilisin family serine protease/subtilisin-like proprotein convertase family protein